MKKIISFSLYDIGNSVFPVFILTILTSSYFIQHIAVDPQTGSALWQTTIGLAGLMLSFAIPIIGNLSDQRLNCHKKYLRIFTIACVLSISLFYFVLPTSNHLYFALGLLFITLFTYEASNTFYNATLKEFGSKNNISKISHIGWGAGYFGGFIIIMIILKFFATPENLFKIPTDSQLNIRIAHVACALWFLIFALPLMYSISDQPVRKENKANVFFRIKETIFNNGLTNTGRFLLARVLYADGMVVAIAGLGIFASSVLNYTFQELLILALIGNILGGIGCLFAAYLKVSDKKILIFSLLLVAISVFFMSISVNKIYFATLVCIGTFFAGPLQSSSRSIMSHLMPSEAQGIGFGLFTASGKITAFVGPLLSAILTFYISQRVGYGFSAVLLLLGLLLILKVKIE
tara:strand:- start:1230 stop:2444 length:1215 start_codon:yes stop_codon:yes gene_type:complete